MIIFKDTIVYNALFVIHIGSLVLKLPMRLIKVFSWFKNLPPLSFGALWRHLCSQVRTCFCRKPVVLFKGMRSLLLQPAVHVYRMQIKMFEMVKWP